MATKAKCSHWHCVHTHALVSVLAGWWDSTCTGLHEFTPRPARALKQLGVIHSAWEGAHKVVRQDLGRSSIQMPSQLYGNEMKPGQPYSTELWRGLAGTNWNIEMLHYREFTEHKKNFCSKWTVPKRNGGKHVCIYEHTSLHWVSHPLHIVKFRWHMCLKKPM